MASLLVAPRGVLEQQHPDGAVPPHRRSHEGRLPVVVLRAAVRPRFEKGPDDIRFEKGRTYMTGGGESNGEEDSHDKPAVVNQINSQY